MDTLYISKDAKLAREDSTLVVKVDNQPKKRFPVNVLKHVIVTGECGLTTSILGLLSRAGVRVTILDWYGNVSGTFEPLNKPRAAAIRMAQSQAATDSNQRLDLAKRIVDGGMANMLANIRYRFYRGNKKLEDFINPMNELKDSAKDAKDIETLMGYEGNFRSWYYMSWKVIDIRLEFGRRCRRPPNNPINCLISWFNSLTYSLARNEIAQTHLDDCISFLHAPNEARFSLALDLAEIFKPVLADTVIIESVLRGAMKNSWFKQEKSVCLLSESGRKETLDLWSNKIEQKNSKEITNRILVRREALSLERHLLGMKKYKPYKRKI